MQAPSLMHTVKEMLPNRLRETNRKLKRRLLEARDARRDRADVFTEIYERNKWGGEQGEFCSGEGSNYDHNIAYCDYVRAFIAAQGIESVVDIGCGDFQISRHIADPSFNYHGVDVVAPLVEHNNREFGSQTVTFSCRDVVQDELPNGELVLVREVLQHLSNAEILQILEKLKKYPFAIVTEYQPSEEHLTWPNIDKAHGWETRIWQGSGVYLEATPFCIADAEVVVEIIAETEIIKPGERIVSYLLKH